MRPVRLSEIARLVGGELIGEADPELHGVAGLADAGVADLSFVNDVRRLATAAGSAAGALLVGRNVVVDKPSVQVDDPYQAFARVLAEVQTDLSRVFPPGIHETAVINASADVAGAVAIGPYCVIGAGAVLGAGTRLGSHVSVGCDVTVGSDCLVYPQVVIREGCRVGCGVILHAGVVLGSDGFGYLPGASGLQKIPQVGIVVVADGVEIGAGTTVDRATTGETTIATGTKIDNQVQIAHNVQVGSHCALSAQVGIAGSCVVEDGVVCGGQVGVNDHVKIGAGSQVGGQTGIVSDLPPESRVFGTPALDVRESFRTTAAMRRLPGLLAMVRELKQQVAELKIRLDNAEGQPTDALEDQEN